MATLYPPIQPYVQHSLPVTPPHVLHVEECGNPAGIPVVFLHGGPGAGCEPWHRQFFDPERYRIVLFDQRGCGRSTPHASLEANTTQDLVADIEHIRRHLGIERWLVFGGSWGSTLGLVYAQTHPDRVTGLILRGVFLCRPRDIQWFYQDGASRLFPDLWADFLAPIPPEERHDLVQAYYRRLTGDNEVERMAAALAWAGWEGRTATLRTREDVVHHFTEPYTALALARIECHYFAHGAFLEPDQILQGMARIRHLPGVIVHGRYDCICPLEQAHLLAAAWPEAEYHVIPEAGHSAIEPGILSALVEATDAFAERLS
ncbi:MAG: prolyl aminopeptidase [Gammaproteobacteria bacterium]|nr:MAG: prolyl aminopeptidase [Gammaproteobacteria bacterium]